jgi:hypothetical protein
MLSLKRFTIHPRILKTLSIGNGNDAPIAGTMNDEQLVVHRSLSIVHGSFHATGLVAEPFHVNIGVTIPRQSRGLYDCWPLKGA